MSIRPISQEKEAVLLTDKLSHMNIAWNQLLLYSFSQIVKSDKIVFDWMLNNNTCQLICLGKWFANPCLIYTQQD